MARYIHSLDNGRGTMGAFTGEDALASQEPKPLMAEGGEPSGFAKMKDGSYQLGNQLYVMKSDTYHNVDSFMIDFKEIPNKDNHDLMATYARAWRERMMKKNPTAFLPGNEEYWIIGMPTGWRKKSIVDAYRQVFIDAGYKNPIIVPESNAAMAAAQHSYSAIARANSEQGVLCIDLGAYSNDATFVNKDGVFSYGGYTGASLIERMMLVQNLKNAYGKSKKAHNEPDLLQTVINRCKSDRKFYNFILLQTRKLKETYYSASAEGGTILRDITNAVELDVQDPMFSDWDFFTLYTNDTMMNAITKELSIRSVLGDEFNNLPIEMQNEIGNKTWAGCLRTFIEKATELCPLLAQAARGNQTEKATVVLTGGAGLMPFVEDTILEVLPNIDLYKDRSPMSTIAKGLWYFGPDKLKQLDFERAFDAVLNEEDSDGNSTLNIIISNAHDLLGARANQSIAVKAINCVVDSLKRWGNHEYDSGQVISRARANFKKWFYDDLKKDCATHATEAKRFITTTLNEKFRDFLAGSGMDNTTLFEDDELSLDYIDSFLNGYLDAVFELVDEQIAEENEIYSAFPNPGRIGGFLGTSRSEYMQAVAEKLDERNENWGEGLMNLLKSTYDSNDVYRPFLGECLYEMQKALEDKKRTMLGALIVEDPVDDD